MTELELNHLVLRYCRQIIMKMMDHVRSTMRGGESSPPQVRRHRSPASKTDNDASLYPVFFALAHLAF